MHRAEPNVPHAAETMRAGSAARIVAGERIRPDFSPEAIGRVARQSLLHLLRPTSAAKWRRIDSHDRLSTLGPPVPIPGRIAGEDQDLSHITLRSRGGVTRSCCAPAGDRTRYTGYRIAAQRFQEHPLPVRMAWELFIFSPS
jgi:hypothetical protein